MCVDFEYLVIIFAVIFGDSVRREIFEFQMQWGELGNVRNEVIEGMNGPW